MKRLRPLFVALQFLTRLPLNFTELPNEREIGESLLYYPLVGLLVGIVLAALAWALRDNSPMLQAALLLTLWVWITGALHLDGLADSVDAWVGGQGSRERTLAIMKDPCCGPAGAVALILVLLVKFAALEALAAQHEELPLVLAPLIGRTALPALLISTPYVRPGGLGEVLARECPRGPTLAVVFMTAATIALAAGTDGLWSLASAFVLFVVLRDFMRRRLDGTTGDSAGAMVELVEASVLLMAAMV